MKTHVIRALTIEDLQEQLSKYTEKGFEPAGDIQCNKVAEDIKKFATKGGEVCIFATRSTSKYEYVLLMKTRI